MHAAAAKTALPRQGISHLIKNLQLNLGVPEQGGAGRPARDSLDSQQPQGTHVKHGPPREDSARAAMGGGDARSLVVKGPVPDPPKPTGRSTVGESNMNDSHEVIRGNQIATHNQTKPPRVRSFKRDNTCDVLDQHEKLTLDHTPIQKTSDLGSHGSEEQDDRKMENKTNSPDTGSNHEFNSRPEQHSTNALSHHVEMRRPAKPTLPSSNKGPRPPALPSKVNRPRLQRQRDQVCSQDDWELALASCEDTKPGAAVRQARSMDNLDAPDSTPVEEQDTSQSVKAELLALYKKSLGVAQNVPSSPREVDEKNAIKKGEVTPTGMTKKVSSPGFLRKRTNEVKDVDRTSKHEIDGTAGKQKPRWSIGDKLKSTGVFENLLRNQKNTSRQNSPQRGGNVAETSVGEATKMSPRSKNSKTSNDQETLQVKQALSTVKPAELSPNESFKGSDGGSGSDVASCSVHGATNDSDDEYDDDDMYDDNEWDDVSNADDEETSENPTSSPENNKRKSCYENVTNLTMTFKNRKRLVEEIVSSEQIYVSKLYLLNKTSWEISGANLMLEMVPPSVVHRMFPCVEAMYQLHAENILPALKLRLEEWSSQSELSTLWRKYLPFLTMYKTYTTQYDWALETLAQYRKSSSDFSTCLSRLQNKPEFGKLTLEQHLLEPIQRLTRYRLLLQNYSKLLTSDNTERDNIAEIVDSFNKLLNECQSQLKRRDRFGDMCKLQETFEDQLSVLTPTAQLVKQGPATQIRGATSKKTSPRQLFLFTDWLLVCSKRHTSGKFHIVHQLALADIQIEPVDQTTRQLFGEEKTFRITAEALCVQIHFKDADSRHEWYKTITDVKMKSKRKHQLRRDGTNSDDGGK